MPPRKSPAPAAAAEQAPAPAAPSEPKSPEQVIADLQAQIAALTAQMQTAPAPAAKAEKAEKAEKGEREKRLEAALLGSRKRENAARNLASRAANEEVYEVRSAIGATVSVEVSDAKGTLQRMVFEKKGTVQFLTAGQIAEVKGASNFFDLGYLVAPEFDGGEVSPNVIEDYDAFIAGIAPGEVAARVAAIDNGDVLMSLYHHIETMRFEEKDGDLVEVPVNPTVKVLLHAVLDRLRALTGMSISASDGE
jgi:hypothetical protein